VNFYFTEPLTADETIYEVFDYNPDAIRYAAWQMFYGELAEWIEADAEIIERIYNGAATLVAFAKEHRPMPDEDEHGNLLREFNYLRNISGRENKPKYKKQIAKYAAEIKNHWSDHGLSALFDLAIDKVTCYPSLQEYFQRYYLPAIAGVETLRHDNNNYELARIVARLTQTQTTQVIGYAEAILNKKVVGISS
jgi:hypothetical protein